MNSQIVPKRVTKVSVSVVTRDRSLMRGRWDEHPLNISWSRISVIYRNIGTLSVLDLRRNNVFVYLKCILQFCSYTYPNPDELTTNTQSVSQIIAFCRHNYIALKCPKTFSPSTIAHLLKTVSCAVLVTHMPVTWYTKDLMEDKC